MPGDKLKVIRFTAAERITHWLVALTFVYAALTGLSLWSPRLYWLSFLFGGGPTVRGWHPWGGVLFVAAFIVMFIRWQSIMRLDAEDRRWLRMAHRYATHDYASLPEPGRFNGGQKSLFWLQAVNGLLLLATGIVLWRPDLMPRGVREIAVLFHPIAAVIAIGGLIVHIYMGTAATPGAFRGMTEGWVKPAWAASHHPKWYRKISRQ